jgi:hypothetical protein
LSTYERAERAIEARMRTSALPWTGFVILLSIANIIKSGVVVGLPLTLGLIVLGLVGVRVGFLVALKREHARRANGEPPSWNAGAPPQLMADTSSEFSKIAGTGRAVPGILSIETHGFVWRSTLKTSKRLGHELELAWDRSWTLTVEPFPMLGFGRLTLTHPTQEAVALVVFNASDLRRTLRAHGGMRTSL